MFKGLSSAERNGIAHGLKSDLRCKEYKVTDDDWGWRTTFFTHNQISLQGSNIILKDANYFIIHIFVRLQYVLTKWYLHPPATQMLLLMNSWEKNDTLRSMPHRILQLP